MRARHILPPASSSPLRRAGLWLVSSLLLHGGCATSYVVPGPRADLANFGSPSIQASFATQATAPFPATLAVAHVQAPSYVSARMPETLAGAATGRYRVITTREAEDDAQVERLEHLPQATGLTAIAACCCRPRCRATRSCARPPRACTPT